MSVAESMLVALFCITVVFVTLVILWGLIRLFTYVISILNNRNTAPALSFDEESVPSDETLTPELDFSVGELKLHNVDEQTAAMIMAIVSDESGIPLSELRFHSIKERNTTERKDIL